MQTDPERSNPDRKSEVRIPDHIPIFPLPNVVFFPKTYLPLHIFEPRYRDMVADAAAEGRCVGMALLKDGWETEYYGNPPIFEVGCVGRLVNLQRLPDGRYNILLQGLQRYVIQEQFYDRSYRRAHVALKSGWTSQLEGTVRTELLRVVAEYLRQSDSGHPARSLIGVDLGDEVLVNSLSAELEFSPLEKQFLLEADTLLQQTRRLLDLIQFKLSERNGGNKLRQH